MGLLVVFNFFFYQPVQEAESPVGWLIRIDFTNYLINTIWRRCIPYAQKVLFHHRPDHSELGQLCCIAGQCGFVFKYLEQAILQPPRLFLQNLG